MSQSQAEHFLRQAVREGKFGDDAEMIACTFSVSDGKDQFASKVVFVALKLKQENAVKEVKVFVKMQHEDASIREALRTDVQFCNEATMYGEILPFINYDDLIADIFPKFYYGKTTSGKNPSEDVIVLEDLRSVGYRMSPDNMYLDYEHCVISVKQLGRFHALSYAAKQRDFKQFTDKVHKLRDARYSMEQREDVNKLLGPSIRRGVEPLIAAGQYREVLTKFLVTMKDDPVLLMLELFRPEEPTAVLCLGDFCRNNLLYKYKDKPENVKMFDLGTSRYSSPAIDLSFFFFLNLTPQTRKERWDDLLAVYHDSLSTAIPGIKVPTLEDLKEEMRRKAVYGYIMCSFFLPLVMDGFDFKDLEDFARMDGNELEAMGKTRGGTKVTDVIVDLVRDLVLHGCVR